MRFSIVTPSFQQAAYLEKTICSVLDQAVPDLEYFVMDGGSSDGSAAIIEKYAPRLSGWVSEKDRGQADAINKGFSSASGEIFGWINSDDFYLLGTLAKVERFFASHPEIDLVYGDVLSVDAAGQLINVMRFTDYSLRDLMTFQIISQPGVFFRRSLWQKSGGMDLSYAFLLDHALWLKMLCPDGRMVHLPEPLAAARFYPEAKNRAHAAEFGKEAERLAEWLLNAPEFAALAKPMQKQIRGGAAWLDANYLSNAFQPRQALRQYRKAFWLSPGRVLRDWRRVLLTQLMALNPRKAQAVFDAQARKRLASLADYRKALEP